MLKTFLVAVCPRWVLVFLLLRFLFILQLVVDMMYFNRWAKEKILRLLRQPLFFRKACLLSIFLHTILFFIMSLIVVLFEVPNLYKPPLVFDFAYIPTEDIRQFSEEGNNKKEFQPAIAHNKTQEQPQDLPTKPLSREISSNELQTKNVSKSALAVEELNYVPKEKSKNKLIKPFYISSLEPLTRYLHRLDIRTPNLVSAKITMSKKQRKHLLKKVKKLAQKLHKLEYSDSTFVWKIKGQRYDVKLHLRSAQSNMGLDEVLVEVSTKESGQRLITEMRMRRMAFSNFAQFVDYWDPYVAVHNDELDGRFHTNTSFTVSRRRGIIPKFNGKVSTAGYKVRSGDGNFPFFDQESVFLGGIEFGVKPIRIPKNFLPFSLDATTDSSHSHLLTEETWITFNRDGSYSWQTASAQDNVQRHKLPKEEPFLIAGIKKSVIHVKGVIKGKVLVYSAGKIIIDDDLTYVHNPEIFTFSDDYLGLVSEKDIEIARPSVTGPGDLNIFASIFAKRRFRVGNLYGNGEATLYIYGSLSAGSLTATEPRYATRVRFDKRLETRRPPYFPMTNRYEMFNWDGRWRVKSP